MTNARKVLSFGIVIVSLVLPPGAFTQTVVKAAGKTESSQPSRRVKDEQSSSEIKPKQKDPDELIHFGDLVDVDVLGSVEYDWRGKVTPEGFLAGLPFTGDQISAICEDETSVANRIAASYGKFLNNPKVVVTILDRSDRAVSRIFGAIERPYRFKIRREVFLNELIILAGGITERASGEIQILRQTGLSCATMFEAKLREKQITVANENESEGKFLNVSNSAGSTTINITISHLLSGIKEANPRINYGDLITVREAEPVYVIGAVERPAKIALRSEITVSRAISSSGGLTKGADAKDITIFRKGAGGTEIIKANLTEIAAGKTEDLLLKPLDIVEVAGRRNARSTNPPVIQDDDQNNGAGELPLRIID